MVIKPSEFKKLVSNRNTMPTSLPLLQYDPEPGVASETGNRDHQQTSSSHQASSRTDGGHAACRNSTGKRVSGNSAGKERQPGQDSLQELSRERRRRAFIGMLKLLEHGAKDAVQLNDIIAPMSDEELLQVAEERALAGKCGNPLCSKPFLWQEPKQKYRATAANIHKIEGDCYCSKACRSIILQLSSQLVNPLDRIQPQALQQHLAQPSHEPKQGVAAQGGGVPTMKSLIQERDAVQLAQEAEQAGKQLDEGALQHQQARATTAALVEGFKPRVPASKHRQKQQQSAQHREAAGVQTNAAEFRLQSPQGPRAGDMAVSAQSVSAASSAVVDSDEQLQINGYLQAHREHQEHQLKQVMDQHSLEQQQQQQVIDSSLFLQQAVPAQIPDTASPACMITASSSTATAAGSACCPQVQSTDSGKLPPSDAAADRQPHHRKRQVTFAPDVQYSCPAEPQDRPEESVLTFTMHNPGSALDHNSSSSTAGVVGELRVTSAAGLEQQQAAATADDAQNGESAGRSNDPAEAGLTEAWRLFFPPALGGVGVPVKQLVQTRPSTRTNMHKQQSQNGGQRQQMRQQSGQPSHGSPTLQQQQQQGAPVSSSMQSAATANTLDTVNGNGVIDVAGDAAAKSASSAAGSHSSNPRVSDTQTPMLQQDSNIASSTCGTSLHTEYMESALQQALSATPPSISSSLLAAATAFGAGTRKPASSAASAESAAPKPRKFNPIVRPRRSVVVLDAAPDVVVKQRGVVPKRLTASVSDAVEGVQQQQLDTPDTAAAAAAAVASAQHSRTNQESIAEAAAAVKSRKESLNVSGGQIGSDTLTTADSSSSSSSGVLDGELNCARISTSDGCDWHEQARSSSSSNARRLADTDHRHMVTRQQHSSRQHSPDDSISDSDASSASSDVNDDQDADHDANQGWGDSCDDSDDGDDQDNVSDDVEEAGKSDITKQLQGALDSLVPFLDTKGVTVHLSEFGLLWNALHAWISPATLAYINNKEAAATAISAAIDNAVAAAGGGIQADEPLDVAASGPADEPVPSMFILQQRTAFANMLSPALPLVMQQLSISVPQAELNRHLHALVRSFYMSGPLPPFKLHHWQMVVALMLAALSAWRVPSMRQLFSRRQPAQGKLEQMLVELGSDMDRFTALLDLFELDV